MGQREGGGRERLTPGEELEAGDGGGAVRQDAGKRLPELLLGAGGRNVGQVQRQGGREDVAVVLAARLLEPVQGGAGGEVACQARVGGRALLRQLDRRVLGQGDVQRPRQEAQLVQVGEGEGRLRRFRHLDQGVVLLREQHLDPHHVPEHACRIISIIPLGH